jgi:hypothetical protein
MLTMIGRESLIHSEKDGVPDPSQSPWILWMLLQLCPFESMHR